MAASRQGRLTPGRRPGVRSVEARSPGAQQPVRNALPRHGTQPPRRGVPAAAAARAALSNTDGDISTNPDATLEALRTALTARYDIAGLIGRGGHGLVFLARELRLDRPVALKVLSPARAFDAEARDRFLREASIAARLSHPHIVPVFAVDEADRFMFYAMAYVEGETLADRLRRHGRLPPAEVVRVLSQTASALAYAHARGIVHRDVKPENILLERGSDRVLVTDFGIARATSDANTDPGGRVRGTAAFISPEQVTGLPVDGRADLYALGVVGFYALAGRLPFTTRDDQEMLARHVAEPAPRLDAVAPWVPAWLADAIARCLEKTPAARFADAEAFVRALGAEERRGTVAPLAIRAFLTEGSHLSALALAYGALLGVVALPAAAAAFLWSDDPILRGIAVGGLATLLVGALGFALRRVRRLVAAGHHREELVAALAASLERRREELAFVYGERGGRVERLFRGVAYLGVVTSVGAAVRSVAGPPQLARSLELSGAAAAGVALLAAVAARARTERRTDPKAERRLRFWRGAPGRWLFGLAGIEPRGSAADDRHVTPGATG